MHESLEALFVLADQIKCAREPECITYAQGDRGEIGLCLYSQSDCVSVAVDTVSQLCSFSFEGRTIRGKFTDIRDYIKRALPQGIVSKYSNFKNILFSITSDFMPSQIEQRGASLKVRLSDIYENILIEIKNGLAYFGYSDTRTGKSYTCLFNQDIHKLATGIEEIITSYNTRFYSAYRLDIFNKAINLTAKKLGVSLGDVRYTCSGSGIVVENQGVLLRNNNTYICRFVISQYSAPQQPQFAFGLRLPSGLEQNIQLDSKNLKLSDKVSTSAVSEIKKFIKALGI